MYFRNILHLHCAQWLAGGLQATSEHESHPNNELSNGACFSSIA